MLDEDYCPRIDNVNREKRKVDFVLALAPTEQRELNLQALGKRANPTDDTILTVSPVAALIETKRNQADAKIQLATWAFGIFKYMRDQFGAAPKFLPLISVHGEHWFLYYATEAIAHDVVTNTSKHRLILYGQRHLGRSDEAKAIPLLIGALGCIYEWAAEKYKPWVDEVLNRARSDS